VELFVATENQLNETAEMFANRKSHGGVEMGGDTSSTATNISAGAALMNSEVSAASNVDQVTVSAVDVSEGVADMSCDSDTDVFVNSANRTFTLTSPVVMSMPSMQEAHADRLTSAENQPQSTSAVSAASERQVQPVSGLITSLMSAANQQQAPSVVSATSDRYVLGNSLTTSVTSRHILPVATSNSPSCFPSGILSTFCCLFFASLFRHEQLPSVL